MNIRESVKQEEFEELSHFEDGIRSLGEKAKDFWRKGLKGKIKSNHHDIVTQADTLLEKDIKKLITKKYPQAKIVGEESGGEASKDFWVIDPIDGTSSFAAGLPTWTMVIAHIKNDEFVFSMIYVPIGIDGPELYYAKKGKGAFVNGKKLHVSQTTDLKEANIFIRPDEIREDEEGKMRSLIAKSRMFWMPGSTSLVLSYLAAGKLDVAVARNQPIWDRPGTLLVEEAGGKITLTGGPKNLELQNVIATNGHLHDVVLDHLNLN